MSEKKVSVFFEAMMSAVGAEAIISVNQEFGGLLADLGARLSPIEVALLARTPVGLAQMGHLLPRIIFTEPAVFGEWIKNDPDLSAVEVAALGDLTAIVAGGLRIVGFSDLSEDDRDMIRGAGELSEAFLTLGLHAASCYFGALSRADNGGYLEPFLLLEGFTDYPWVRPRPEDWAHLSIAAAVGRSQFAAANLRSISQRIDEFPTGSHRSIWALMRRLSDTFDSPPITRRLSEALDALTGSPDGWQLAEALAKDLNYINSISVRYALNEAFKKEPSERPPES